MQLKKAGLQDTDIDKSFGNYKAWNTETAEMKNIAISYYKGFENIKKSRHNSLALLGQSGAGKTHLLQALINNFLKNRNLRLRYMSYSDIIYFLKQNSMNAEIYQGEINKYKNAELLIIDDMFKLSRSDTDVRIMFEIINYRYINHLPIAISSEYCIEDFVEIDNALGGRIKEMTQDFVYQVRKKEIDYRLRR